MLPIPSDLHTEFEAYLIARNVQKAQHGLYAKWLRFYLDFCRKYHFPEELAESLPQFLKKLHEKRQTSVQQQQASDAISLYYDLLHSRGSESDDSSVPRVSRQGVVSEGPSYHPVLSPQEGNGSPTTVGLPEKTYDRSSPRNFLCLSEPESALKDGAPFLDFQENVPTGATSGAVFCPKA